MTPFKLRDLIALAERIYHGRLSGLQAFTELEPYADGTTTETALIHLLYHFVADHDIRERDPEYRALQRRQLRDAIACSRKEAGGE